MSSTATSAEKLDPQTISREPVPPTGHTLPRQPVVTIEGRKSSIGLNLSEIWQYRELLYFLTWRDVKVRYKQSVLGITWVIMQPVLSTIIFTIFLGILARVPSDAVPYPILVFAGLLPWTFFSTALTTASLSLVANAHLITKIYFPRILIPTAAIASRLLDFGISFIVLLALMIFYRVPFHPRMLALPLLVILTALLATAVAIGSSALHVRYRDVGVALPVLIQLWMFASPVVYPSSLVYSRVANSTVKFVYGLNPFVGIIDNFRALLFGSPFNWPALWTSTLVTIILFVLATFQFRRMERSFADVV